MHPFFMQWATYILFCSDNSYYVGHTQNIARRLATHNAGKGANYTAIRRPVNLVFTETHPSKAEAIAREVQIKKWSRAKKQSLIDGDVAKLHELARRHST